MATDPTWNVAGMTWSDLAGWCIIATPGMLMILIRDVLGWRGLW